MAYTIHNEIRIGSQTDPSYRWANDKIVLNSLRGVFTADVLANELSVDTFTVTVRTNIDAPLVYSPTDAKAYKTIDGKVYILKKPTDYGQRFLTDIAPATPVYWYVNYAIYMVGYFQNVQRVGRHLYKITCESAVGLLNAKTHVGGLYSGVSVTNLLSSIIGTTFPYYVTPEVGAVTVYGHLPYDNARNNLHKLLFAIGAVMMRNAQGSYSFTFLSNSMTNVPPSRVALGGKTEYVTPSDSVEITEHSFFALNTDETVQLFDNTNGASVSNQLVIFDQPMHDLAATGNLTINSSSVNHAIVSGVGTLTGKQYTHNAMIVKEGSTSNNVRRVTSNELISFANSYFVARRVYSYYSSTRKIDANILLENERPGMLLALRDGFGDPTNAYLSQVDLSITTVKMGRCKLIAGFQPGANGNNFSHRVLITADATWTVPSGVTRIRIVLIGGATGGQGGYDGADGLDNTTSPAIVQHTEIWSGGSIYGFDSGYTLWGYENDNQPSGVGGAAGEAGAKAAFLVSDQAVVANDAIAVVVGAGGAGGARNGGLGSAGTPSTAQCSRFGTLSSADGLSTYEGYNDPVSGITYAISGVDGEKGGDGGQAPPYGWSNQKAPNGESVKTYGGGSGGTSVQESNNASYPDFGWHIAAGAGGGGAAFGAVGGAGSAGTIWQEQVWDRTHTMSWYRKVVQGGNGGNGANAVAPSKPTIYGQGGAGGHGGGGGGNAAGSYWVVYQDYVYNTNYERIDHGTKGTGGQGSAGSAGGDGCCIIYY